jgi:hypothetical protein
MKGKNAILTSRSKPVGNEIPVEVRSETAAYEEQIHHRSNRRPNPLGIGVQYLRVHNQMGQQIFSGWHPNAESIQIDGARPLDDLAGG